MLEHNRLPNERRMEKIEEKLYAMYENFSGLRFLSALIKAYVNNYYMWVLYKLLFFFLTY